MHYYQVCLGIFLVTFAVIGAIGGPLNPHEVQAKILGSYQEPGALVDKEDANLTVVIPKILDFIINYFKMLHVM
jgi:hypothetical protein